MLRPERKSSSEIRAFTLVEMLVVIAVLVTLIVAGVGVLGNTGAQARRSGSDMLSGLMDQARTAAITTRSNVVLAIAEPGDLPATDERCRVGLFKVDSWAEAGNSTVDGVLMSRWKPLESGIVLSGGDSDGLANPMDAPELTIRYGTLEKPVQTTVHAIAFNPRGGLLHPSGSGPIAVRIAEGSYRNGEAVLVRRPAGDIAENVLKVGRVTARPYRIDP